MTQTTAPAMTTRYVARADSLPARVISYLQKNPEAELTRRDIHGMFGVESLSGIDGMLSHPVGKKVLARGINRDDLAVWTLGPNRNVVLQESQTIKSPVLIPSSGTQAHNVFARPASLRLMHIPIMRNTPIDPIRRQPGEVSRWLSGFQVGDSAEVNVCVMEAIDPAIQVFEAQQGVKFLRMTLDPDRVGIERTA